MRDAFAEYKETISNYKPKNKEESMPPKPTVQDDGIYPAKPVSASFYIRHGQKSEVENERAEMARNMEDKQRRMEFLEDIRSTRLLRV